MGVITLLLLPFAFVQGLDCERSLTYFGSRDISSKVYKVADLDACIEHCDGFRPGQSDFMKCSHYMYDSNKKICSMSRNSSPKFKTVRNVSRRLNKNMARAYKKYKYTVSGSLDDCF